MKLHTHNNQPIILSDLLGKGGEARVHNVVSQPDVVAKLYHQPLATQAAKLRAMLSKPPMQPDGHIAIAWPSELLLDDHETVVGFLMPRAANSQPIFNLYNPVLRQQLPFSFSWQALLRTATNLATVTAAIHAKGHVIGDINESNILVNEQALVTLVDTDSFQIMAADGTVHRCLVGKPEYTPPELQGIRLKTVDQTVEHDLFGLGILLFQLLMEGFHPFAGVLQSGISVGRVDLFAIREGLFPYHDGSAISPPPAAPPFEMLPPLIQTAFADCFVEGHRQPSRRPTAAMWHTVLQQAEELLATCKVEAHHVYGDHLTACPWCAREQAKLVVFQADLADDPALRAFQAFVRGLEAYQQNDAKTVITSMTVALTVDYLYGETHLYRAWGYQQQGEHQKAVVDIEQAIEHETTNKGLAYFMLGSSYQVLGAKPEAWKAFTKAIRHGYQPVSEAHQRRAEVASHLSLLVGKMLLGGEWFYWAQQPFKDEDRLNGFKRLRHCIVPAYQQGDYNLVFYVTTVLIKQGFAVTNILVYRAWAYYKLAKYQEAMDDYQHVHKFHYLGTPPINIAELILFDGVQAYQKGDSAEVLNLMNLLIHRNFSLKGQAHTYRSWAYFQQQDYHAAADDYLEAMLKSKQADIEPNIYEALYQRGLEAFGNNDSQTVLSIMNTLLKLNKAVRTCETIRDGFTYHEDCLEYRSWAYSELGAFNLAMADCRKNRVYYNLGVGNLSLLARYVLGKVYSEQGNPRKAIDLLTGLIEARYLEADCFYYRGLARYKIDWLAGALLDVEQSLALKLHPKQRQAAETLRAEIEAAMKKRNL